ncbi:MAG: phosphoribosylglycinamide formyltransferase [marine bacterium B5-7]|nr:MAG: phosphoribosylglycinamide formyltransferase [marine bacterium B5-7]
MNDRLKAAVLISGNGTNLDAIINHLSTHDVPCNIQVVVSNNPSAYGLLRATRAGIPTAVVNHRDYPDRYTFDQQLLKTLNKHQTHTVILAGFMRILTTDFVEHFKGRMLNIHPSLLPKLKGLDTHKRAIEEGHEFHGASVHFVTPELDSGAVIIRGRLRVNAQDTAESLAQRVHQLEYRIYPQAVEWLAKGRLRLDNNNVYLDDEVLPPEGVEVIDENP